MLNYVEAKTAPCINDNSEIRVCTSVLYTILEVVRTLPANEEKYNRIKETLKSDLSILNSIIKFKILIFN